MREAEHGIGGVDQRDLAPGMFREDVIAQPTTDAGRGADDDQAVGSVGRFEALGQGYHRDTRLGRGRPPRVNFRELPTPTQLISFGRARHAGPARRIAHRA